MSTGAPVADGRKGATPGKGTDGRSNGRSDRPPMAGATRSVRGAQTGAYGSARSGRMYPRMYCLPEQPFLGAMVSPGNRSREQLSLRAMVSRSNRFPGQLSPGAIASRSNCLLEQLSPGAIVSAAPSHHHHHH